MLYDAAFLTPEAAYLELQDLNLLPEVEAQVVRGLSPHAVGLAWHSHVDTAKRRYAVAAEFAARHIAGEGR